MCLSLAVVGVSLHVAVEVPRLREPKIADLAPIRLLPAVDPLVLGESRRVGKGLPAVVAPVRSLPRVRPEMCCDRRTLREPLLADGARERLLATVGAKVSGQVSRLREGLVADLAMIRLLARVRSHVGLESGRSGIALPAHLTDVVARLGGSSLGPGCSGDGTRGVVVV